jgi:SNF2 family DNA or RNA helicase
MALTLAEGDVAKEIVSHVSPEGLKSMGSAKTDRMLSWCHEVVKDQGAQAIIFTYFAHTVMPFLQEALEVDGYTVSVNHGGLSLPAKSMAQKRFKDGETQIFLTSDAGSKGLNLPEATYLLHYERPPLHSLFVQRSDRIHRIDSLADTVYIYSLVARGTIEEGLYELNLRRNDWSDKLLGDDETDDTAFLKASDRKLLLKQGRALHT